MNRFKYVTKKFFLLVLILIIVDLLIKYIIISKLHQYQRIALLHGFIELCRIQTNSAAFGFASLNILGIIRLVLQVTFMILFIRIQFVSVNKWYKYSSALVVFGWIGNYLDKIIFSNGEKTYAHLDYFYVRGFSHSILNLSTVMTLTGWIAFIMVIIIRFKDLKIIFHKKANG
ncbi:MAG: signal peptidase II [Bacteroidales bacterium]|nr:signal peptidase II [Bacteroidales bacterium]